MHYIKCLDISQVLEPTLEDVPRIIWVTTGELYADLQIAGEPLRIKISDIVAVHDLPDNPRTTAIYRHNDQYKYYAQGEWHAIATERAVESINLTVAELSGVLNDVAAQLVAKADAKDLDNLVTLVDALSDNVELKASSDDLTALTTRVATTESSIVDLVKADNDLDERVTALESDGTTPDEGTSVDLTEVWEAIKDKVDADYVAEVIKDKVDAEYVAEAIENKADHSALQQLSALIYDTENGIPAINDRLSSVESSLGDKADKSAIANMATTDYVTEAVKNKAEKSELFSGSYNDLSDKPVIPSITGLASEESVNLLIEDVEELEERVTSLESSGPSGGASNPSTEGLATVEYVNNAIKDLATKDDLVYEDNSSVDLQSMFMLVYDDTYGLEELEHKVSQAEDELDGLDSKVTKLSASVTTNTDNIASNAAAIDANTKAIVALQELLAGAAGITFGVLTNNMFQALDLTGSTPATIGDPVDCNIYTFKTPAS